MKIYVQSASRDREYYWAELAQNTTFDEEASFPHPRIEELLEYLDPDTPSLLIATVPPEQVFLLVTGVVSRRRDRQSRFIYNSFLLIFDQIEEKEARAFAAMLLTPTEEDQQMEHLSFHSIWLTQINKCIVDGPMGAFQIDAAFLQVIKKIISQGILEARMHRLSIFPYNKVAIAKNSLQHHKELSDMLFENPLPLKGTHSRIIPLVVVTGYIATETLVKANAWRILTLLSEYEYWYSPPKINRATLRLVALLGISILCALILAFIIILIRR